MTSKSSMPCGKCRGSDIPEMPDRIVAATALYFGVPAISRDSSIRRFRRCGEGETKPDLPLASS